MARVSFPSAVSHATGSHVALKPCSHTKRSDFRPTKRGCKGGKTGCNRELNSHEKVHPVKRRPEEGALQRNFYLNIQGRTKKNRGATLLSPLGRPKICFFFVEQNLGVVVAVGVIEMH